MQHPVTCPHCSASFQSDPPAADTKLMTCPQCAKPIAVGAPAMGILAGSPNMARSQPNGVQAGRRSSAKNTAPVAAGFAPPRSRKKSNAGLVVALCLIAFLLLLGLGGAAAFAVVTIALNAAPKNETNTTDVAIAKLDELAAKPNEKHAAPIAPNQRIRVAYPQPVGQIPVVAKNPPPDATFPLRDVPEFKIFKRTKRKPRTKYKNGGGYRSALSKQHQKFVNRAIDDGVAWLRSQQAKNGSWHDRNYPVGYTALTGLTLLECGATPDDPAVQKAAGYIRFNSQNLRNRATYQMSLVILFLDKLGEEKDRNLIRRLALRLIAGQTVAGGWNYPCPQLTNRDNHELITFLFKTRPLQTMLVKNGGDPNNTPLAKPGGNSPAPIGKSGKNLPIPIAGKGNPKNNTPSANKKKKSGLILPLPSNPNGENSSGNNNKGNPIRPAIVQRQPFPVHTLSKKIRDLPIVQQKPLPQTPLRRQRNRKKFRLRTGRDDNSNTQFAMLALWAARRYGIPVERTLALVDERFDASQQPNGGWGYMFRLKNTSPQMTCVGLIGLGIGHGAYKETYGNAWKGNNNADGNAKKDPRIQKGLKHLGQFVGKVPMDWKKKTRQENLYFLWSLERTAMMYNLKTLGGRDWYAWAAQMLVSNQHAAGNWSGGAYHGSTPTLDTCMALLVLRRANLTEDLTESLQLLIPIADPDARK